MDIDSLLSSADLPEVSVDMDSSLTSTLEQGKRRRKKNGVARAVAACACLLVAVFLMGSLARRGGPDLELATVPDRDAVPLPSAEAEPGDPATWDIDRAVPPSPGSSTFTALVQRLGCSGGVTGAVLRPGIVMTDTEVTITFTAEALPPDKVYPCPGNDPVPYVVDLGQPIGARSLIDGLCVTDPKMRSISMCADSAGVRWRSDGAGIFAGDFSVKGRMVSVGGPAGTGPGTAPDPAPGTVEVRDAQGSRVTAVETDRDGWFELTVPNGNYTVVGRSSAYQNGEVDCVADSDLVVRDRWVDGVTVECHRR